MQQWIQDHSTLLALLIPAIINLVADLWTKWFGSQSEQILETRSTFWAGAADIFRGGGIDVVRVLQGLGQILLSLVAKSKNIGPPVLIVVACGLTAVGQAACTPSTRAEIKSVAEVVRVIAEQVCELDNAPLGTCIDRLVSDPRVAASRTRPMAGDGGMVQCSVDGGAR